MLLVDVKKEMFFSIVSSFEKKGDSDYIYGSSLI